MPGPSSATVTVTASGANSAAISIPVPAGAYLSAFSIRFVSTCSIRTASSFTSGASSGSPILTGRPSRRARIRVSTPPTISSSGYQSR